MKPTRKPNSSPPDFVLLRDPPPAGSGPALGPRHGILDAGPEQLRLRLATAIMEAGIDHPNGRSFGYYASVGIDYLHHPHDKLAKLALAAADAVLRELENARAQ